MKSRSTELVDRAIAAMLSAIEIYNKPCFQYRIEAFCMLALNAWELILKAKWLRDNKNRITSLYQWTNKQRRNGEKSKVRVLKRTGSGAPKTHSIDYLIKEMTKQGKLEKPICDNLAVLDEFRNASVHFYFNSAEIAYKLQEVGMATVLNFSRLLQVWFKKTLSDFDLPLMPLAIANEPKVFQQDKTKEEVKFLKFLEKQGVGGHDDTGKFAVSVNIHVKLSRVPTEGDLAVRITNDPTATQVSLTDDQMLQKFPYNYSLLVSELKKRYPAKFIVNSEFYLYKRRIEQNPAMCTKRYLDPKKKSGSAMKWYSQAALQEFDKYYR